MVDWSPIYNEPLAESPNDLTPKVAPAVGLDALVKVRLELEDMLRCCGNDQSAPLEFGALHAKVFVAMVSESDSPLSASLRAQAAGVVGHLKIDDAKPILKTMAMDEKEDLRARLNAIGSYIQLSGFTAASEVRQLFQDNSMLVRSVSYLVSMKSPDSQLAALAEREFKKEKSPRVRSMVTRQFPERNTESMTQADD